MSEPQVQEALAALAQDVYDHAVDHAPYLALRAGRRVDRIPAGTLTEAEEQASFARGALDRLTAIDTNALDDIERDTLAYLTWTLTRQSEAATSWWWSFPVAPYQTYDLAQLGPLLFGSFTLDGPDATDHYLSLVRDMCELVRAIPAKLAAQRDRGWFLPAPALTGFVSTFEGHRAALPGQLRIDAGRLAPLAPADRSRLESGLAQLVDVELAEAFDEVLTVLAGVGADTAINAVGIGNQPGGEEAYRTLVERYATYALEPDEIHRRGLERVAELTERLAALRKETGFDGDEAAYADELRADGRFFAPSPDGVAATYRRHVAGVEAVVSRWFRVLPAAPYDVERLDPALEPGMTYGYYELPTPAVPVGRYRFNGSGLDRRSQLNAAAIILHELVPGHHFHLARQGENTGLPRVRAELSALELGAFTEGWAEYAASLGFEMGVYDDPWDAYGALVHQRFIAQRLVVDTGLNVLGWTLDQGRDYMARMTMESPEQVATETLRYSTDMPAQALGYGLGFLKFTELRERARGALGESYTDHDFHEVILAPGALPLETVGDNVDAWLKGTRDA